MQKRTAFLLLLALTVSAFSGISEAKRRRNEDTGPKRIERQSDNRRIPSYPLPFPGTFSLNVKQDFPRATRWSIPETNLRRTLAVDPRKRLPSLELRVSEWVHEPKDPAAGGGAGMEDANGTIIMQHETEDDPLANEYHQVISFQRQRIPSVYSKNYIPILTLDVKERAKLLKFEVKGQDIAFSVHKEGFPGALIEREDGRTYTKTETIGNPEYGLFAETGVYTVKLKVTANLDTRFSLKVSYWPDAQPPQPTPTPIPMEEIEAEADAMAEEAMAEDDGTEGSDDGGEDGEDISYEEEETEE